MTLDSPSRALSISGSLTLGEYAYHILGDQYHSTVKHDCRVIGDKDPENLHKMRVGMRRLRTALQVFGRAVELPKGASPNHIGKFARVLGRLRDLDVQIADLQRIYRPQLAGEELGWLDQAIALLKKKRKSAFAAVVKTLEPSTKKTTRYQTFKTTYSTWLDEPQYTPLAPLPVVSLLPDLLSPLLAELLLHPAWLIPAHHSATTDRETLHDLRKACKHVRYQAEFFLPFYGNPFQNWTKDIKVLQDRLGRLQDSQVLIRLLAKYLPKRATLPTLQTYIQQTCTEMLSDWDEVRHQYLQPAFRTQLYQMLLEPVAVPDLAPPDRGSKEQESKG